MNFFKNRMTPGIRRVFMKMSVLNVALFGAMAAMGWWSWGAVFATLVLNGLVVGFWPSNKALAEAEKRKELSEG